MRHKGAPKDHYCGGGIHPDRDTWWVRVRFHPVLGPRHKNEGTFFVQLTPDEAFGPFHEMLKKLKREGKILDYMLQLIEKFWTYKEFERKVVKQIRPKRKK
jgi:hypothetical protein